MFASRFFRRLFLPYLLLICAATTIVGVFAAVRLRSAYLDRTRDSLVGETNVVISDVQNDLDGAHADELMRKVRQLGSQLSCRITVIDADGLVVADNEADPAMLDNHSPAPGNLKR